MKKSSLALACTGVLAASLLAPVAAAADPPSATITGTAGENVSTTDGYDGRHLRYVGNPAPEGYAEWYQWGSPAVLTQSPEDGPVTMAGTLDVSGMTSHGQVAVIGLHDADALRSGDRGDKAEVGISIAYDDAAGYTVGLTDGDAGGGEFVQRSVTLAADEIVDGALAVELVVDGTADPAACASRAADVPTADGCMTLTVNGATVTDSYGTIVPTDIAIETELGNGAHPGWYTARGTGASDNVGLVFDLTISPVVVPVPADTTSPTVTVKPESAGADGVYSDVSFKLYDAGKIDRIVLNGVEKDLSDNEYSDLNGVIPGVFGAVLGANELQVYDVAGNVATVHFTLVPSAPAVPAWNPTTVYNTGDEVTFNGATYVAQWWTRNQQPGDPYGPWVERGELVPGAGTDTRAWTSSWVYTGGETVAHDGRLWRAKWWTRNQTPGNPYGPWENLGAY